MSGEREIRRNTEHMILVHKLMVQHGLSCTDVQHAAISLRVGLIVDAALSGATAVEIGKDPRIDSPPQVGARVVSEGRVTKMSIYKHIHDVVERGYSLDEIAKTAAELRDEAIIDKLSTGHSVPTIALDTRIGADVSRIRTVKARASREGRL